ncbi:hypothetical protein [Pedobacter kyungheensis]|uniref:hypothetical protein n=1 Tax=Pedobacter kyungheensis TaxID=1069985 RepID=UPI0012E0BEF7|nr:hypothetical protein [Pedobacter kyungheensis]
MKNLRVDIVAVLLLCLGSFLFPGLSYAHATKSDKTVHASCSRAETKKAPMHDCCHSKASKKAKHNDCRHKCKHGSCRCCASSPSVSLAMVCNLQVINQPLMAEKQQIGYQQSNYSFGFISIWQPPKIA